METKEAKPQLRVPTDDERRGVLVGIILPVLSQYELAIKAIGSIYSKYPTQLHVIPQYELKLPLAEAWNHGFRLAEMCTHVLVINDDVVLNKRTIDTLVDRLKRDDDCIMATGVNFRDQTDPEKIKTLIPPDPSESEHPDFSCFMMTPKAHKLIGEFDENFIPAYFEDNDYHYRIKLSGNKAIATTGAPYYHYGSATQNGGDAPVVPGRAFEDNRDYYIKKWGGAPGHEQFARPFNDESLSPFESVGKRR